MAWDVYTMSFPHSLIYMASWGNKVIAGQLGFLQISAQLNSFEYFNRELCPFVVTYKKLLLFCVFQINKYIQRRSVWTKKKK